MTCDIFIKGYREQLHWLCYCLQFLEKNWQTDSRFIVLLDSDCEEVVEHWGIDRARYYFAHPWPDGYMHALYRKMTADQWTDADLILLMDSDTLLTEPSCLGDMMIDDKPFIEYVHWNQPSDDAGRQVASRLWPRVVKESMGMELEVDYMVTHSWLFHRSTFEGARDIIIKHKNAANFESAVYSTAHYDWTRYEFHPFTFCDLESLYLYGAKFEPDKYHVAPLDWKAHKRAFKDYWSHTPWTPQLRGALDKLLAQ